MSGKMSALRRALAARVAELAQCDCVLDPSVVGGSMGADQIVVLLGQPDVEPGASLSDWWVSTPAHVLLRPDATPTAWDRAWQVWEALVSSPDLPVSAAMRDSILLGRREWAAVTITIRQRAGIEVD